MDRPNIVDIDYAELWDTFVWLGLDSHYDLEWDDMEAMDVVEGRK